MMFPSHNRFFRARILALLALLGFALSLPGRGAVIPGLFNTGVGPAGGLLAAGSVDPHWKLIQSADPAAPGPNAVVPSSAPFPSWLAQGPSSQWIAPALNQNTGSQPGNYVYRLVFDLTGLELTTAVITGRWSSDNNGPDVVLNGLSLGLNSDGNFAALGNAFTINSGFVDGTNTLDFVVFNAPNPGANPTGFRCELSGTADTQPPPGTPVSIVAQPVSATVGALDPVTFSVGAAGSRPFAYQWRKGGGPIDGATNSSYVIASARASDIGIYDVVVRNSVGGITSAPVTLTVQVVSPAQQTYEPAGPSSRRTGLTFTEIMYHPAPHADGRRTEFVEIYNSNPFIEDISGWRLSGDVDYTFPSNTVLQGNSYLVVAPVPADVEAVYGISGVLGGSTNNFGNGVGTVRLRKRSGAVVLEVEYSDQPPWPAAADGSGHSLVLVRPSYGENNPKAWAASAAKGGSPGRADPVPAGLLENVVINEFLAHTDPGLLDYIELFNNSPAPVDLSGCWLSDDPNTNRFRIPDGTHLDGRGFIAFDETTLGFSLQADGETLYLVNPAQTRVLNAVRYSGQANGVASGRFPDGAPEFWPLSARTPGTTNAAPAQSPIVINEIYYHPLSGDNADEFVELYNRGPDPVDLGLWEFTSGINYTFPEHTIIPADGYLVVASKAARLLTNYPGLNPALVVGDFGGNLSNGGERLALARPDTSVVTNAGGFTTNHFRVVVDEVTYGTGGRWGRWANGGGSSLELIDPHANQRAPSNWADSDETAKAPWTTVENTGVLDQGFGSADRIQIMLLGEGEVLVDDVEVLAAGANRVPNPGFESGTTGWVLGGTHSKSTVENVGFSGTHSLHLRASDRGDQTANRISAILSSPVAVGSTATLRAKVRWLRGHPEILLRLKGGYLEAFGRLPVPTNFGTPGAPNSQARPNAGPAITDVGHLPVLPQAGQPIRVAARVADVDGVSSVTLRYRIDGDSTTGSVPMVDDGTGPDALAGDGIYTGQIPGQPAGKLVAFRVEAVDGAAVSATTQFPADAPARECLVRVGETQPVGAFGTYHLWLTAATVATWSSREQLSNENLDGTFVYGNTRAIYNLGAHYSGSPYTTPGYTSPVGALCGYDMSFPPDDSFLGSTHMVMDWPVRDDTEQREQMMFWMLDQAGLPNMYRRYVIMFVNGVRRGTIYDDVQQPNGDTVEEWFSDDSGGALFKPDCWDEFSDTGARETGCIDLNSLELYTTTGGVKKQARYRWIWKPRAVHGTANDYSEMFSLIDAANAPTNTFISAMESLADMEHWMRTFAGNDLVSYWDAFGNPNAKNTFLYKPEHGTWKLMCWDMDVGLGANTVNAAGEATNAELFPTLNDTQMNRIYATPKWVRLYWCAMTEAVNSFFQSNSVTPLLASKYQAFQASGLPLTSPFVPSGGSGISIPAWVNARRAFLLTQLTNVAANFSVSSNNIVVDRNLVTLTGTAPVTVHTITVNGVAYTPIWTSVTAWRLSVAVNAGVNTLEVVGLDRYGNPVSNASRTVSVTYTGSDELAEQNVLINEIMYNPIVPGAGYVELFNRSTNYAFNLSGWRLNGVDYVFPAGTIIPSRGFLVVCADRTAFAQAYGWGVAVVGVFEGGLDNGGETLTLLRPGPVSGQELVVNRVTYDDAPPWPPNADGLGSALQLIDADQDNNRVSNWSDGSGWKFFRYTATVGSAGLTRLSAFFENSGGDAYLDDIVLVAGSEPAVGPNVLTNGDFESGTLAPWVAGTLGTNSTVTTQVAYSGNASLHFVVGPGAQSLSTFYQDFPAVTAGGTYTLSFWYLAGHSGTNLNFRMNAIYRTAVNPSATGFTPGAPNAGAGPLPPYPPLWLSEVQPQNQSTLADNFGDNDPWIELYNGGTAPLSLNGFFLANNYSALDQWPFPPEAVINPGQFLLVWADGEPGESAGPNWHTNFRLAPTNGTVALSRLVNGAPQIIDYLNYHDAEPDWSYGSFPDGQSSFRQWFTIPTPRGTNNPAAPITPLFINEWMAANVSFLRDPADLHFDDWFELYNPTAGDVDLTGYTLTDDLGDPGKFVVPRGFRIPAHGYLLIWADEEGNQTQTNGNLHVNFKLSQDGEQIGLFDPSGRLVDSVVFSRQTNDVSQGRFPDGAPPPYAFMTGPTPGQANFIRSQQPRLLPVILLPGNVVRLVWSASPGERYQLEFKDGLNDPAWAEVPGVVTATSGIASKDDRPPGTQRFYRVVRLP